MGVLGDLNKWVTLSRAPQVPGDSDGFFEPLSPDGAWCSIQPQLAVTNSRSIEHVVRMRWHPQVTIDTRLVYATTDYTLELFVRAVANVNQDDDLMQLICEQIV